MNARFVNVKVDREERPDVDAVYMDAVQAMTGRGGWPMTVFLTPDGEPFYGGTYFPKPQLPAADGGDQRRLAQPPRGAGARTPRPCARRSPARPGCARSSTLPGADHLDARRAGLAEHVRRGVGRLRRRAEVPVDDEPRPRCSARTCAPAIDGRGEIVTTSLDAMASGGMYDHIGGGFARYSVDRQWLVPHFEKMLYDQALLVRVYAHAAVALGRAALAAGRRRDRRVRAARPAPARRRVLLGRGRRLARARRPRPRGPVPHVDRRRGARRARRRRRRRPRLLRHHGTTGNFEGRSIPNRLHARGRFARPPAIEDARRRLFDARAAATPPGPRRQGADRVERADDRGARRGRCAARPAGLDRRRGRGRRLPPPRAAPARRALVPLVARRRRAAGPPRRARRRPRLPRRRVHPARPRPPARPGGSTRPGRSPTRCSTTSGTSTTAGCSRRPTTARRSSPGRRTCSTTPRRRPTRPPRSRSTGSPR